MKRELGCRDFATALAAMMIVGGLIACGDDDSKLRTEQMAFPADRADYLAHAALPHLGELPGTGWEVATRDKFSTASGDDAETRAFFQHEPACTALTEVPGFYGSAADKTSRTARAEVSFQRPGRGLIAMPAGVEVQLEIDETAAEIDKSWKAAKPLFDSGDWQRCMLKAIEHATPATNTPKLSYESGTASATSPRGGVAVAFDFAAQISTVKVRGSMEFYFWAYSNAQVTVIFLGGHHDFTPEEIAATLAAVDNAVNTANEREPDSRATIALVTP